MFKKTVSFILASALCLGLSAVVFAQDEVEMPPVTPRYVNEINAYNEVSLSGGKAILYSEVNGSSDVTKVVITQVLQKKSGTTYKNVSGSSKSKTFYKVPASFESSVSVDAGTYRVKTTYKVTSPRGTDTHTKYSKTVTK